MHTVLGVFGGASIETSWLSVCRRRRPSAPVVRIVSPNPVCTAIAIAKGHVYGPGALGDASIALSHTPRSLMLASDARPRQPNIAEHSNQHLTNASIR